MSDSENDLVFPAEIDLAGLDRDLITAEAMIDRLGSTVASKSIHLSIASDVAGGKSGGAGGMISSLIPATAAIAGTIASSLGQVKAVVKDIGATISRQLKESFSFAQAQDGIRNTKDIIDHDLKSMRRAFDQFAQSGLKSGDKLFDGLKAKIASADHEMRRFLLHASANLKKGGTVPVIDTIFARDSKSYSSRGKDKAASGTSGLAGNLLGAVNPLKMIRGEADSATGSMLKMAAAGGVVGLAIGGAAAGFGFISNGIKGARDLNETISKTGVILGDSSGQVVAFSDEMASKFGLVKNTTLDISASFAGLGKSLGRLNGGNLAGFSTQFTKLAADLSSFENIGIEDAAEAIRTGLSGNQSDLLKKLGVVLTEDTVKAYAFSHGIAAAGTELNEQQKFMARQALISQGLSKVNGDLERTGGGAANQSRKLWGNIENLATTVGQTLIPAFTEGLVLLNEFASGAFNAFESNKETIASWAEGLMTSFDYVVATVHNFPAAWEAAKVLIREKILNITEYFGVLGPNIALITDYIGRNWKALLIDLAANVLTFVENSIANIGELGRAFSSWLSGEGFEPNFVKFTDGFIRTAEKLPELIKPTLTDLSEEFAKAAQPITDEVATRKARRLGAPAAAKPVETIAENEAPKAAKHKKDREVKFAGALELGSKEAYSSIVNATAGRTKGMEALEQSGRQTAGNTAEMARLQREANRNNRKAAALVIA